MASEVKARVLALLDRLPDNCTLEDVMYHVYVLRKIQRGEEDVRKGRIRPHRQTMRQMRALVSRLPRIPAPGRR